MKRSYWRGTILLDLLDDLLSLIPPVYRWLHPAPTYKEMLVNQYGKRKAREILKKQQQKTEAIKNQGEGKE